MGFRFNPTTGNLDLVGDESGGVDSHTLKDQILFDDSVSSVDTIADSGTVHERITKVEYSSPNYPGNLVEQIISYTFTNLRYKISSITWVVT